VVDFSPFNRQFVDRSISIAYTQGERRISVDQIKIGKFISAQRKSAGLTQAQLAERLMITDRAVSKWETGRTLPDSSIMLKLCEELNITVNDLLTGERVSMENYNKEMEQNLMDMVRQKEEGDRKLLRTEIVLGVVTVIPFLVLCGIAAFVPMEEWLQIVLILAGALPFLAACFYAIRIEQTAGYYACRKCGHRHVPTYASALWAPHVNRTRYMRCPKCGERSWQKKVISKDK